MLYLLIEQNEPEYIYYVKYDNNFFYLVIDDLKCYFRYYKEKDKIELEFIIEDQVQAKFMIKYGIK